MTLETQIVRLATQKEGEILDITDKVQTIVENGTIKNGVVFLFVPGSTAALTIVPRNGWYEHERRWPDRNGHSHVRASLIGPDLSVPFERKKLMFELGSRSSLSNLMFDHVTEQSSSIP